MTYDLLTPLLDGGIRNTNFFNGRVLAAQDLQDEQAANRHQRAQLGRALGTGVVYGLEVRLGVATGERPTVKITPGLALNRNGQALAVSDDLEEVEVALVREEVATATEASLFATCQPPQTTKISTNTGVYVLLMCPASGYEEEAPKVGLSDNGVASGCGSKYAVEGVQFRLVELDVDSEALVPEALADDLQALSGQGARTAFERSLLRNLVAHWCLGTVEAKTMSEDLYDTLAAGTEEAEYGPLDVLRGDGTMTDCDVPLAALFWTGDGIEFLDMWAVRRRLHQRLRWAAPSVPFLDRRGAEAEASFLQFQAQIAALVSTELTSSELLSTQATDLVRYLPSVAVVPFTTGASTTGFDSIGFLDGLKTRDPVFIEGSNVLQLMHMAFAYPPVHLACEELIWVYMVRENRQTETGGLSTMVQPYYLLVNGHLPYMGDAQYDLSRWNFSNYAPGVAANLIGGMNDA